MAKKVSELQGAELDRWVANAHGMMLYTPDWQPSRNWAQGGPIIERAGIDLQHVHTGKPDGKDDPDFFWAATMYGQKDDEPDWENVVRKNIHQGYAKTPLEAAMRCYVASKFGDEVEE